jgi:hypothetical protein
VQHHGQAQDRRGPRGRLRRRDVAVRRGAARGRGPRDASGCNHHVCIEVTGKPAGYQVRGSASAGRFGHVDIWGPGLKATSGADRISPSVSGSGQGYGTVCAEFWHPDRPGHWVSDGLACEDVH